MSKQKVKRYLVDITYEHGDTGEDEIQLYNVPASSKSEAVIKAVNIFTDDFRVNKVVCMRGKHE